MKALHEVSVGLSRSPYKVLIGAGALQSSGDLIASVVKPGRCVVVTDSNVAPLYADAVEASLSRAGFLPVRVTVPAGESSKALSQVGAICDAMIEAGLDRSSLLVALGGGVIGDLAGLAAAVYYRGIPYIQIPTTIVSQVDSSVGGKTGVNAAGGKNLIGSFHQPKLVIADTETLRSLPARELNEGFAEVIKHAAIRDPDMLDALDVSPMLVARNVAIKAAIVAEDEFETKGLRALLNFGHTIGHGIEAAAGYGKLLHGEAISLGLLAACRLSVRKAGLTEAEAARVSSALEAFDLPARLDSSIETDAVFTAIMKDKKFAAGSVRFVLLRSLGDAYVSSDVTPEDIRTAIEELR
jgi:3-dehydroquinate synthase